MTIPFELAEEDDDSSPSHPVTEGATSNLPETAAAAGRFRILLADDDATIRNLVKTILNNKGYEIVIAKNGEEAVKAWKKEKPALGRMDVQMPLLDGLEAVITSYSIHYTKLYEVSHTPKGMRIVNSCRIF